MSVYYISETWFNCAEYLKSSPARMRLWKNPDAMTNAMIERWNQLIAPATTVYHLGNVATGRKDRLAALLPRLNGKITVFLSEMDADHIKTFGSCGWTCMEGWKIDSRHVLSHYPLLRWPRDESLPLVYGLPDDRMDSVPNALCPAADRWGFAPVSLEMQRMKQEEKLVAQKFSM